MKTRTLKYMMTAVLLLGATVAVAGSQPRKVKVKSVVKASAGMKKASSQQRTISSASALVGTYTAVGGNQRNVASWPVTITTDNSTSNKVWLANLSPHFYEADYQAPTYNYFYGTLNSSKTELHIPVGQRMTGTYSFTGNGTQYNNQIVYIGAYDEYNCSEGYINVHEDDIVIRIENNGSRLVLTDSVFFYSVGSDNTFWMLDEVYNNTVLTKEAGQDDGVITLTTAGTLDTKVSGTETSLVIRGPLNSADLKVLRDMCVNKNLTSLDISGANIVGGNTTKYYNDYSATDNDVLPKYLFYNSKLETLVLPSSIKKLDNYCFAYSSGLTTITIPASVTNLTSYCFYGCSALTAIYVENGNTNYTHYSGVLYTKDGKTLVKYPEGKSGTSYTVNSGVTSISDQAFANAKLTSVTLPTTLKELGYSVFSYSALTTLSIPASVTTVTTSTFSAMSSLTSFSVASGNTVLSNDSRGVLFDKNKTVLKAYPQGNTSTTYTIPSTVTEIEYDAFWTNNYLKKITLPDNVTTIGGYAFGTCHSLKEINIPAKVTKFGNYAFNSSTLESVTSAITSPTAIDETVFNSITTSAILYVPAGTKSKYQSLTGWNKFTNIVEQGGGGTTGNVTYSNGVMTVTMTTAGTLQSSIANSGYSTTNVTELVVTGPLNGADLKVIRDLTTTGNVTKLRLTKDGKNATIVGGDPTNYYGSYTASKDNVLPAYLFYNSKLTNIYLPNTITSIESNCFGNSKQLVDLSIPASVTSVSSSFVNGCSALTTLYVGSGSSSYDALNGVLYTKDLKTLVRYPEGLTATSFSVRSGVTAIASYAFYKAKLTSISLPTTLQSIGSSTFSNSSIKTLSIPASVTSVATTSFSSMSSLTSFSVASGSSTLSTDTRGALFDKNKTILKAYPLGNTSTTYTIPSTVVELEYDAFWGHDYLKTITLPNGVKTIGGWALSGCSSLEEVNIPATVTKIDGYAFSSNQNLKKITSDITTPFDVADDAFSGTCDVATLYVPAGTKSKYQSKNGWKLFKTIVEQGGSTTPTAMGNGTLSNPYNAVAATNVALGLSVGSTSSQKYYIKGKISSIKYTFSSDYGTATFYISDDGTTANQFCVYGTYYLENKPWVTGNPQIAIGDDVIIYGNITNYSGTAETADKKSYVYSHNGMTSIGAGVTFNNGTMTLSMSTAGTLQTAIASSGYSAASVRELVIIGPINGTDIRYIRLLAGIDYNNSSVTATLETLNLEKANIVSGGVYYKSPSYATSDNVVGQSMFADTQLKYIFLPKSATTIMSQAFGNCKQLMGVTVYNKVTSVPSNLFNDCSALCYIDWQPTRGLTSGMLPTSSVRNPNLLLYVTSSSYAPYTTPNVVIGSTATQVTLTNGYAFWAPREFTATNISYSRSFTKTTGNGSAQGWETITLPFQPTKISHATKGELVPFGRWSGTSDTKKPFWLYGFGSSGFTASNYLSANQPYIIAMPNNTMYDDAYRVNGTVTFSATSATVKASLQAVGTTNGVRTLRPAYQTVEATNNKYVLNANGSQFVTYRAASPFEAYFTTTEANARGFIDIFDELPTGIESIPTVGTDETPENVYDLQGRKVVTPQRGIYIRNGKKVIVR